MLFGKTFSNNLLLFMHLARWLNRFPSGRKVQGSNLEWKSLVARFFIVRLLPTARRWKCPFKRSSSKNIFASFIELIKSLSLGNSSSSNRIGATYITQDVLRGGHFWGYGQSCTTQGIWIVVFYKTKTCSLCSDLRPSGQRYRVPCSIFCKVLT